MSSCDTVGKGDNVEGEISSSVTRYIDSRWKLVFDAANWGVSFDHEASEGPQEKQNCAADGGHPEVLEEWKVPDEGARGYEKASEFFEVNYCGDMVDPLDAEFRNWVHVWAEIGLGLLGTQKMSLSDFWRKLDKNTVFVFSFAYLIVLVLSFILVKKSCDLLIISKNCSCAKVATFFCLRTEWIKTACASKLGIVGEVYSELQGLQAWLVGQKIFKITLSEQQIFEQKKTYSKSFDCFHAFKKE